MTALRVAPEPVVAGVEPGLRTKGIGLSKLTLIEVRKLADTRSGMWLLIVIAVAAAGTAALSLGFSADGDLTFQGFFTFALVPSGILLPVLGILSMTGEWSQRTALTTFTLVPARGRVIAAKLAAGVLVAIAATLATAVFAAVANLIGLGVGGDGSWHLSGAVVGQALLLEIVDVLSGLGLGALLLSSPLAIVTVFALPTVFSILEATVKPFRPAAGWLDLNLASGPLSDPGVTGGQWARLGVSVALWVLLPLSLGTLRVLRREVS